MSSERSSVRRPATPSNDLGTELEVLEAVPLQRYLDLGTKKHLSSLWIYDTNGKGDVVISAGEPGKWKEVATYDCGSYLAWAEVKLDATHVSCASRE